MSDNSSIDINTTSDYVIIISCTDGTDTTFVNLTLRFTPKDPDVTEKTHYDPTPLSTTMDPAVTEKPATNPTLLSTTTDPAVTEKTDTDLKYTTPIIIGASIGELFLLVVIIVVCVRKRQHKNNDENKAYAMKINVYLFRVITFFKSVCKYQNMLYRMLFLYYYKSIN